jgi:hypothetical protein
MYLKDRVCSADHPSMQAPRRHACRTERARALAYCVKGFAERIGEIATSNHEAKHPARAALRFGAPRSAF